MPQFQAPALVPDTIELRIPGTTEKARYIQQEKLGEGVFSDVYRVSDCQGNSYALKMVKLDNSNLSATDRIALMRLIKKEAAILKKLGMLKGLKKHNDSVLMLMPYIQGITALERVNNNSVSVNQWKLRSNSEDKKIIKDCFRVLLELHNKNIVHLDPHLDNYIYDAKTNEPVLVDFGFAQDKNKFNALEDSAEYFTKLIYVLKIDDNTAVRDTLPTLIRYYYEFVIKHIKDHKIETAFKIFAYGVGSIAAIYGLGTFAVARMLIWAYCKTISLDFVTDVCSSMLQKNQAQLMAQKCLNGSQDSITKELASSINKTHLIMAALLFWGIFRGIQSPIDLIQKLYSLTAENSPLSQAFWRSALNSISALEIGNAALFYYPASNTYAYLSDLFEGFFSTEQSLAKDCENFDHNTGWLHYFKFYNTSKNDDGNRSEVRASPNHTMGIR